MQAQKTTLKTAPIQQISALILFSLSVYSSTAKADLLAECNQTASAINQSAPQVIDKVTTLINSVCFKEGSAVTLQYRNKLDVPSGAVDQARINTLKPAMVNFWCTDPTQRKILNLVNIQYTYSENNGKYIGKVDIARRECKS